MSTDKRLSSIQPYPYSALKKGRKNLESDSGVQPPKKIEFFGLDLDGKPRIYKNSKIQTQKKSKPIKIQFVLDF
jgi:hypothetical protein